MGGKVHGISQSAVFQLVSSAEPNEVAQIQSVCIPYNKNAAAKQYQPFRGKKTAPLMRGVHLRTPKC